MNISASELRRAADIQDKIESLRSELDRLLGDGVQTSSDSEAPQRKHRKMSAAARAKIAVAARARWAKVRAGKK